MSDAIEPAYESSQRRFLPEHLRRIASRDYVGVNEGFWALRDAADEIEALHEEINLLRARAPRKYILARKSEWVRLFREVHGYLRACHRHHGTDWDGRNRAMDALIDAMKFMEADDAARETMLAALREAEQRSTETPTPGGP